MANKMRMGNIVPMIRPQPAAFITLMALLLVAAGNSPLLRAQDAKKPLSGYSAVTVEKFTAGTLSTKEGFPQGFEGIMQKTAVAKLTESKLFEKVVDGTEAPAGANNSSTAEQGASLILSGTIIGYDPGSQAARAMLCCGAGAAKVKVRFIFRDGQTGKEVLRSDQQGKYSGTWALSGGSTETGTQQAAKKVIGELIKEIQKKR